MNGENYVISIFVVHSMIQYSDDKINVDEMYGFCSTHSGDENTQTV